MLTGLAGLAVGWGVIRSLAGLLGTGSSELDYLGENCLPSLALTLDWLFHYVDILELPLC